MEWNVYHHNINKGVIEPYNVFNHCSFREEVEKLLKKKITREEFEKELNSAAMYYFWSKAEYEVVITSFPPYIGEKEVKRLNEYDNKRFYDVRLDVGEKIDIYNQLKLNWSIFVEYVWSFKK